MRNLDVFDHAVCKDHDPDVWHDPEVEDYAKALCLACPALAPCLDFATDPSNEKFTKTGVWGGMGDYQRARLRARRSRGQTLIPTQRAGGDPGRYQTVTFPAQNCQTPMQESSL